MEAPDKPKTVSILEVLATLPSGTVDSPLDLSELGSYLARYCNGDNEKQRNSDHALRDELYRDGGIGHMKTVIERLFRDPKVRELRQAVVPYARFNNVIKRIVNEMSTVYSEPARRSVGEEESTVEEIVTDEALADIADGKRPATPNNDAYQRVLEEVRMDERAVEIGRLLNLHRALLVGFRVRVKPNGERQPVIDIATPANVRVVTHPNDESLVIGWLIKCSHRTARASDDVPTWVLWTDHEVVQLRDSMTVISYEVHGLGVCPWVPVTLGPSAAGFWPGCEGEDLVAGHTTIWLEGVLLIKESKSATKQTIIQGDGTAMGRGQSADTEVPGELADGQSATTVDMSMDLNLFKGASDHVLDSLALNYGLLPSVTRGQHAESAEARELQMLPLKRIRRAQQTPLRLFEMQFAIVMSAVLKVDLPAMYFAVIDWLIEFAESETPLDPSTDHELFLKERAALMDNTVDKLKRKHPGLDDDGAWAKIERSAKVEERRNKLMRPMMAISGSPGASTPDGERTKFAANRGRSDDDDDGGSSGGTPAQDSTAP